MELLRFNRPASPEQAANMADNLRAAKGGQMTRYGPPAEADVSRRPSS